MWKSCGTLVCTTARHIFCVGHCFLESSSNNLSYFVMEPLQHSQRIRIRLPHCFLHASYLRLLNKLSPNRATCMRTVMHMFSSFCLGEVSSVLIQCEQAFEEGRNLESRRASLYVEKDFKKNHRAFALDSKGQCKKNAPAHSCKGAPSYTSPR